MIRTPVGQSQHLLLGDVIGKQRTVMPLHHKLIAAAITHHMSLHTIAHEQVTHLWLQGHLLGIRILSYRHTYSSLFILHSSFFTLHLSCFTVLYCLLQFLIFVMDKLLRTLFTNAESVVQTIALIFFLPFSRMMVDILQPTVLAALYLLDEHSLWIIFI